MHTLKLHIQMMRASASALVFLALLLAAAAAPVDSRVIDVGSGGAREEEEAAAAAKDDDAFYRKVGNFAVVIYSLWHKLTPVPALERVVSAATRPARGGHGGAVDYLLVLRVAGLGTCEAVVWGVRGEGSEDWKLKHFKRLP